MGERRTNARQKSFLQGRIYYNKRRATIDCLIRDLSDQGAKLKVSESFTVPEVMELYIPNRDESYRARVQWRVGEEIGVAFGQDIGSPSIVPGGQPTELADRVRRLEAEVATLQRRLRELSAGMRKFQGADD